MDDSIAAAGTMLTTATSAYRLGELSMGERRLAVVVLGWNLMPVIVISVFPWSTQD